VKSHYQLLVVNAYQLYSCALSAPSPNGRNLLSVLSNPQVGDLVMEISTIYSPERDNIRVGRLLRVEAKPLYTDQEWQEQGEVTEPIPTEKAYVIESLLDEQEITWTNANFIKVVESREKDWVDPFTGQT